MLTAVAAGMGATAQVALRINPDGDAGTHAKITTGRADNKFGIAYADAAALYAHAAGLPGLRPVGLALHIGSQIMSMTPYRAAYARTAELVRTLRVRRADGRGGGLRRRPGHRLPQRASLHPCRPSPAPCARRSAAWTCAWRWSRAAGWSARRACCWPPVILSKTTGQPPLRGAGRRDEPTCCGPAMYDAWHGDRAGIAACRRRPPGAARRHRGTGLRDPATPSPAAAPCRRSSATARLAILDAGAYGSVMSSTYNSRPLAAQVMVDGDRWSVIRERQAGRGIVGRRTHSGLARMSAVPPGAGPEAGMKALARKRQLARLALWWEQAWPAAWPPLGIAGRLRRAGAAGRAGDALPAWPRLILALAALAAVVAADLAGGPAHHAAHGRASRPAAGA